MRAAGAWHERPSAGSREGVTVPAVRHVARLQLPPVFVCVFATSNTLPRGTKVIVPGLRRRPRQPEPQGRSDSGYSDRRASSGPTFAARLAGR